MVRHLYPNANVFVFVRKKGQRAFARELGAGNELAMSSAQGVFRIMRGVMQSDHGLSVFGQWVVSLGNPGPRKQRRKRMKSARVEG